jgi:hypothetical protein
MEKRKSKLVHAIREFVDPARRQIPLHEWLRLLGQMNWALNVFPMLTPALNSSWDKVRGKSQMTLLMGESRSIGGLILVCRHSREFRWREHAGCRGVESR